MQKTLVTSYVNPDIDGVACAIAYAELLNSTGKPSEVRFFGEEHDEAKYVMQRFGIGRPESILDACGYELIALVDTSQLSALENRVPPENVTEIIDHRAVNDAASFPNAAVQIELVGSAATLIAEKFFAHGVAPSRDAAILLYSAIISNTLNFTGSVTTERDRTAAASLNNIAKLSDSFARELFEAKSDLSGTKLAATIEGDFAQFNIAGKNIGIAQLEVIGANNLIATRKGEIIDALHAQKRELRLDYTFLNTIDLAGGPNIIVALDRDSERLLTSTLAVHFAEGIGLADKRPMRKQIAPLLRAHLEGGDRAP